MTKEPQNDDEKERDEVLKRMLNTPPNPRENSVKKEKNRRKTKKEKNGEK